MPSRQFALAATAYHLAWRCELTTLMLFVPGRRVKPPPVASGATGIAKRTAIFRFDSESTAIGLPSPAPEEHVPDHLEHDFVGIAPTFLAEELRPARLGCR